MTFCTHYIIILVIYSYLLYNYNLLYLMFELYTKLLTLFSSSQNIFYKVFFVVISRNCSFLSFNQNKADVKKIIH